MRCDDELVEALTQGARSLGIEPVFDPLLTADSIVNGAARETWAAQGYAGVDMETGRIAASRVAAVRVVLDTPASRAFGRMAHAAAGDAQTVELATSGVVGTRGAARGQAGRFGARSNAGHRRAGAYIAPMVIERIDSPADVKRLKREEIDVLASEIRELLVTTCAVNGGHLAPNLGVVELTLALHRVLDLPTDKLVWDVSHQTYVHKILTGRRDRFGTIRKGGGLSGFAMRSESPYDPFGAGHASTSVASALGMALARDLVGGDETVVAVLGDGALTGGLAYEALNNAGALRSPFIVILNDNEMSIAPNVGSIAAYLSVLRTKPFANFVRRTGKEMLKRLPLGTAAKRAIEGAEIGAMHFIGPAEKTAVIFEELGFRYIGPVDGHNYDVLVDALQTAKDFDRPVLLHVRTVKGKGYEPAERDSRTFHGIGANAFEPNNGGKRRADRPDVRSFPTFLATP